MPEESLSMTRAVSDSHEVKKVEDVIKEALADKGKKTVDHEIDENDSSSKRVIETIQKPFLIPMELAELKSREEAPDWECCIQAAFRAGNNEVFIFLGDEYVVIRYDPAESTRMDCVVKGPLMLCDGFPSIYNTLVLEERVVAAFGCHDVNEAFFFGCTCCVKIVYAPDTRTGAVVKGPMEYGAMFPCLKGTGFDEQAVDAALESTVKGEAYLFQGSKYALIDYRKRTRLICTGLITDAFPCLGSTELKSDIGAAFASHAPNQAYLFKDDSYLLVNYGPPDSGDAEDSYIIAGPEETVPTNWPSLQGLLPFDGSRGDEIAPKTWLALCDDNCYLHVPILP